MDLLGDIIKMGSIVTGHGANKKDKYLVLFPSTLLMLSTSNRLSAFIYEGKLPLSGLSITKPDTDIETNKECSFDISGPLIETISCKFRGRAECEEREEKISEQIRTSRQSAVLPSKLSMLPVLPAPPPHKTGVPAAVVLSPGASRSPRTGLASRGQGQGVQGWKMNCIRPAPPTRSFFQADKRNTLRRKGLIFFHLRSVV